MACIDLNKRRKFKKRWNVIYQNISSCNLKKKSTSSESNIIMQNDCIGERLQEILCTCDDIKGFHAKIVITNNGIQMLAFSNDMFNQRLDHAKVVVADNGI